MLLPNAHDKFLGMQLFLGPDRIDWGQLYEDHALVLDVNSMESQVALSLAVGARVVDGVLALHSQNLEALNQSASQIDQLARRLGVSEGELARAKDVQKAANKKDWLVVYSELSRLQVDVIRSLDANGRESIRPLVIAGGWMQAANFMSQIVIDNYTPETSNYLREPGIVKELMVEMEKLSAETKADPSVRAIIDALPEIHAIVDIPKEGSVPLEKVERLQDLSSSIIKGISLR
jgi:hypothetical protein